MCQRNFRSQAEHNIARKVTAQESNIVGVSICAWDQLWIQMGYGCINFVQIIKGFDKYIDD